MKYPDSRSGPRYAASLVHPSHPGFRWLVSCSLLTKETADGLVQEYRYRQHAISGHKFQGVSAFKVVLNPSCPTDEAGTCPVAAGSQTAGVRGVKIPLAAAERSEAGVRCFASGSRASAPLAADRVLRRHGHRRRDCAAGSFRLEGLSDGQSVFSYEPWIAE